MQEWQRISLKSSPCRERKGIICIILLEDVGVLFNPMVILRRLLNDVS